MTDGRITVMEPKAAPPETVTNDTRDLRRDAEFFNAVIWWRCPKCNTLLAKLRLTPGSYVEIKCAKCNTIVKEAA